MVEVKIGVLVSVCDFSVDAGFNSSIGVSRCHCVEKGNRSVVLLFHGELNVFVDRVEMVMKLSEVRSGEADVAVN